LENARIQAEILIEQSEPVKQALVQKKTELYYGLYDVESGRVDLHKAKLANQAIGI
jgi:hypothetical protein